MMFKEEYKNAYNEITAPTGSTNKILERAKCNSTPKRMHIAWKTVIVGLFLTITLTVSMNLPTFAQEIARIINIWESDAIDYAYFKSLQRENPEWTQNAFIPENATVTNNGIIMKVELATFCEKEFIAVISFANEEGFNLIRKDAEYHYYDSSVKIGESIPQSCSMEFMKFDNEKAYYLYTAKRHTARIPESETICMEIHGLFESRNWEESIDLSNVSLDADTRIVKLHNSNVDETLIALENSEFPYLAPVLNMTPLSEIKTERATVTGLAYVDGILRIQTCQPDNDVSSTNYAIAYSSYSEEKAEQLIWYEKIDGQLMLFIEDYYIISEEALNDFSMVIKFNEKNGAWNTTWSVAFEVENN